MGTTSNRNEKRAVRFATATVLVALTITLIAGVVPHSVAAEAATDIPVFQSQLADGAATPKLATPADPSLALAVVAHKRTATVIQPVVAPRPAVRRTSSGTSTGASNATGTGQAAAAAPAPSGDETGRAQSILAGYIAKYPILAGSSVSIGDAKGNQAIAYYKSGRIVISPTHTASLERIIGHEIWHIIDWRDNGVIDWGENVPPK